MPGGGRRFDSIDQCILLLWWTQSDPLPMAVVQHKSDGMRQPAECLLTSALLFRSTVSSRLRLIGLFVFQFSLQIPANCSVLPFIRSVSEWAASRVDQKVPNARFRASAFDRVLIAAGRMRNEHQMLSIPEIARLPVDSNTFHCGQSTSTRTSLGGCMRETSEFARRKVAPLREGGAVRVASGTGSGGALHTCSSAGRQHAEGARSGSNDGGSVFFVG
jgi:hypothetical protein